MKISDLEFYCVAVPRSDSAERIRSLLLRIASDTGLEGWGEARLDWRPAELDDRRQALLPLLSGRNVYDTEELLELDALRPAALKSALEMALWDLIGREAHQPIAHFLGGIYRARVPISVRLPAADPQAMAQRARELSDHGFYTQFVTTVGRVAEDIPRITALAEGVGDRVEFCVDGQNQFDLENAAELCFQLERLSGIRYLIDPIRDGDMELFSYLRRQTSLPLGLQRSVRSPGDVLQVARSGAARLTIIEFDRVGGLSAARKCAAVAEAGDAQCAMSTWCSVGPAVAATLQIAAAVPRFSLANDCVYHELRDDILAERLDVNDGMITVPKGPGLGLEVDRAKVERYLIT